MYLSLRSLQAGDGKRGNDEVECATFTCIFALCAPASETGVTNGRLTVSDPVAEPVGGSGKAPLQFATHPVPDDFHTTEKAEPAATVAGSFTGAPPISTEAFRPTDLMVGKNGSGNGSIASGT